MDNNGGRKPGPGNADLLIDLRDISRTKFRRSVVVGGLVKVTTTARGDVNFTFQIPYEFRDEAIKLFHAYGEILKMTVEPYSYDKDVGLPKR